MKMAKSVQYLTADVTQWLLLAFSDLTKLTSLLRLLGKLTSILRPAFDHISKSHLGFGPFLWPIVSPQKQISWGPLGQLARAMSLGQDIECHGELHPARKKHCSPHDAGQSQQILPHHH